jgi:redox-sensitive bicupin YhaK (pirin superfamily)
MLDYNSPWTIPPQWDRYRPWVGYHPHRGFETVTVVFEWEIEHQDTAGNGGIIGADDVQWMTAGSWLLHNEFMTESFARTWGVQHVAQLWVNLPREHKMTPPRYQSITQDIIPKVSIAGGFVRVIAWEFGWVSGAAETFSPVTLLDIRFTEWGETTIPIPNGYTAMLLIVEWTLRCNDEILGKAGDMLHFSRTGDSIDIRSDSPTRALLMAGKPLDEPIAQYGPFVMNTEEEIQEAFRDLQAGKMWREV